MGAAEHWDHRQEDDHFAQPGALFRLMPPDARQRLFDNTARAMGNADRAIKERHVPGFGIFSTGVSASVIRLQVRCLFKSAGRSMPRRAPNGHRAVAN